MSEVYINIVAFSGNDELDGAQDEVDFLLDFVDAFHADDEGHSSSGHELFA